MKTREQEGPLATFRLVAFEHSSGNGASVFEIIERQCAITEQGKLTNYERRKWRTTTNEIWSWSTGVRSFALEKLSG